MGTPQSFKVSARPALQHGELERAPIWARSVAKACHKAGARYAMGQAAVA
jgi:hypothetical protein